MIKIQNVKLVIMLEYQDIKIFFQTFALQIEKKKFQWLKKVKNTVPSTHIISDLKGEETGGMFYENKLQKKSIKNSLELK